VNVGTDPGPSTPGTFHVRVHFTETDAGTLFGPVSSREIAEKLLLTLAARTDVKKAELEVL
jgi:hypothetical protein